MQLVDYRGKWAVRYGKRRLSTGLDATPENREAAERKAGEILGAISKSSDFVEDVYDAYWRDKGQKDRQRYSWKALAPHFTGVRVNDISRQMCRDYADYRRKMGKKDGTIITELTDLSSACNWFDKFNTARIEKPSRPAPRDRHLTKEEMRKLLDAAQETPHLHTFLHIAYATAARKEAILQLQWEKGPGIGHVDLDRGIVDFGLKPNGKKRAVVPMTSTLREVLQEAVRDRQTRFVVEYGGRPVRSVKTAFHRAVRAAGIDHLTIHDIRHTAAVHMAGAGVPMSLVSQYLGHSSTGVTEQIYARYQPDHMRSAAEALEL